MGLSLLVGIFSDLKEADEEGYTWGKEVFGNLNKFLESVGISLHREPEDCKEWSRDMYGYSGLHYLRRIAAHLDLSGKIPEPGDDKASSDSVLEDYFRLAAGKKRGILDLLGLKRKTEKRTFDHLILHSDAEGYYLLIDFKDVLFPDDSFNIPGGMVGSSVRLLDELKRLADALQIPSDVDLDAVELWMAEEGQGKGLEQWRRYAIESYSCLCLMGACEHSIKTGAALVFT
jgi:hypothetical protein